MPQLPVDLKFLLDRELLQVPWLRPADPEFFWRCDYISEDKLIYSIKEGASFT
jgi:hypothetical protein